MSITKTTTVDQITVTENVIVLYRKATRIMEDDNRISIQLNSPQRLKTNLNQFQPEVDPNGIY
jgi:hypothetical protein